MGHQTFPEGCLLLACPVAAPPAILSSCPQVSLSLCVCAYQGSCLGSKDVDMLKDPPGPVSAPPVLGEEPSTGQVLS